MRQGFNKITIMHSKVKQNILIDWNIIYIVELAEAFATSCAKSTLPADNMKFTWKNIIR